MDRLTLSVNEAAKLSGFGRDKLYELTKSPDFPSIHLGRSIRIPRRAFEEWIEREAKKGRDTA